MDRLLEFTVTHGLAFLFMGLAVVLGVWLLLAHRKRGSRSLPLRVLSGSALLFALGGFVLPREAGPWLAGGSATLLFLCFVWLVLTTQWSAPLAWVVAALGVFGLGAWLDRPGSQSLTDLARAVGDTQLVHPEGLVLLALVPVIILRGFGRWRDLRLAGRVGFLALLIPEGIALLAALGVACYLIVQVLLHKLPSRDGIWLACALLLFIALVGTLEIFSLLSQKRLPTLNPGRRWVAIGLRCFLLVLLALAVSDPRFRQGNDTVTVLFVVDRSLSVPDFEPDARDAGKNERWRRVQKFIKGAVEQRGDAHKRDQYGLILFGRYPRLELPPSNVQKYRYTETPGALDRNYTDIGAALKLALASFPEGTGRRIVLISDGNENLGNAVEQARLAEQNGVQIDVLPLAPGYRNETEVLVQSVEAPPMTEQGARFPVRVLIRSYNPNPVIADVSLERIVGEATKKVEPPEPAKGLEPGQFIIRPGLNSVIFPPPAERPVGSYSYIAKVEPRWVIKNGQKVEAPKGFLENKTASTHVLAVGQRQVLLVEGEAGEHDYLHGQLAALGEKAQFTVKRVTAAKLAALDKEQLGRFLLDFDCVILANVPADALTEDQQEMIRSNTHNQGCGLVMIGGDNSFGAGGWQATPVEKALPVDCDIKSAKVEQPGGLVLIFHASEADQQNGWQKAIGKLAIKKLGPADFAGVLEYDGRGGDGTNWQVPFQKVGDAREQMLKLIDTMAPGDMPDCNPSFNKAYDALTKVEDNLGKKHIIFISDGDHWRADPAILRRLAAKSISCSTVLVTTHGNDEGVAANMQSAVVKPGKFYPVTDPKQLPEIYTKEARLVSQSFIYKQPFTPKTEQKVGPADKLPDQLEQLHGFVRTTPKPGPSVVRAIQGPAPPGQEFPVLAFWQYGLGRSVAFTSDARSNPREKRLGWDKEWAGSKMYRPFWERLVEWSLRATESGALTMTTEFRDGKVKVIIEARDKQDPAKPLTDLRFAGGVTTPSGRVEDAPKLKFEQKNSGRYEAEFKADEAGAYFITAQPRRTVIRNGKEVEEAIDTVRAGVTVPYSPEFADLESNAPLLDELSRITGGQEYADEDAALTRVARAAEVFRAGPPQMRSVQPFWHWLLLLAGFVLVLDVAVRRIAIEPEAGVAVVRKYWGRLRGEVPQAAVATVPDRMQMPPEVADTRASARFEAGDAPVVAPSGADDATAAPSPAGPAAAAPPPGVAPEKEGEPADFASRLMRAKKKVWEDRDNKDDNKK